MRGTDDACDPRRRYTCVAPMTPAIRGADTRDPRRWRPQLALMARMARGSLRDYAPPLPYPCDCGRYSYPVVRPGFKPGMGASTASW